MNSKKRVKKRKEDVPNDTSFYIRDHEYPLQHKENSCGLPMSTLQPKARVCLSRTLT